MPKTYELFREDEWTEDGRIISLNAIKLPEEPIPITGEGGGIVGMVTNVRREGNVIFGDAQFSDGVESPALTVSVDKPVFAIVEGGTRVTSGRLRSTRRGEKHEYPWGDDDA